jgi:hypothetical protein
MRLTPSHLAGLTVLVLFGVAATAPAAPLTEKPKAENPVEKVRKALDEVIDLDLAGQPLSVAIEQLRAETKINFVVDQVAIAQMGVDPMSSPVVTTKLTRVKARTALRNVLDQLNLSFVIVGEVVHISTEEMAIHRQLRQRVSLDLNGTALQAALKQLAKETGTNLLVDGKSAKEAQTVVTLQLDDVPLETAVRLMAEAAGLKAARVGNVLVVTTKAHATELRAEPDLVTPKSSPGAVDPLLMPGGLGGAAVGGPLGLPVPPPPAEAPKPDEKR